MFKHDPSLGLPDHLNLGDSANSFRDKTKEIARSATVSALGGIRRFMDAASDTIGKISDELSQPKPAPAAEAAKPPQRTNPADRLLDIQAALRDLNNSSQGVLDNVTRTKGGDVGSITRDIDRLTESLEALSNQKGLDSASMDEREKSINDARARLIEAEKQFGADVLDELIGKTWGGKKGT